MSLKTLLSQSSVIPVITLHDVKDAVPLAEALMAGGLSVLEITLRTKAALEGIRLIKKRLPECKIAAGTVTQTSQFQEIKEAGVSFAVSPAITLNLIDTANALDIPFLPGVVTPSEVLAARELGCHYLKFFPANLFGGVKALKNYSVLFPDITFCPTGGITQENLADYLALPNVVCVGGSWLTPPELIKQGDWKKITQLAKATQS